MARAVAVMIKFSFKARGERLGKGHLLDAKLRAAGI